MRGNVDTRLRKVDAGECDAIVLARAGLVRLGLEARATAILEPEVSLPAVGQGALGIECRIDDAATRALLAPLARRSDEPLRRRGAWRDGRARRRLQDAARRVRRATRRRRRLELFLRAFICEPDGTKLRRSEQTVAWPASDDAARVFGEALGAKLRAST